jgi:hypothetical protein
VEEPLSGQAGEPCASSADDPETQPNRPAAARGSSRVPDEGQPKTGPGTKLFDKSALALPIRRAQLPRQLAVTTSSGRGSVDMQRLPRSESLGGFAGCVSLRACSGRPIPCEQGKMQAKPHSAAYTRFGTIHQNQRKPRPAPAAIWATSGQAGTNWPFLLQVVRFGFAGSRIRLCSAIDGAGPRRDRFR